MVAVPGAWKNFDELEEDLTLEELAALLEAAREKEHRWFKFMAGLKGIDLDKGKVDDDNWMEQKKLEARAKAAGKSVDEVAFGDFGFEVIIEEE